MDKIYIFLLIAIASLAHATWNLLSKKTNSGVVFIWLVYVLSVLLYMPVLIGLFCNGNLSITAAVFWLAFASSIIHLFYFLLLQAGYRNSDLSVVYPLARGSGPLLSSVAAIFFLHEKPTFFSVSGLVLIVAGVMVITRFKFKAKFDQRLKQGLCYGLGTGFFIAAYTVVDSIAVKQYSASPFLLTFATNLVGAIALFPFLIKRTTEIKQNLLQYKWNIIGVVLLSSAGYILILIALKFAPLTIVAPSRELSIIFGVFMGNSFLKETDFTRRLLASILILAGIICLAMS
jgi:drug/metabolite transporter (DMT)-like permease